jgi:TctA family transporter
LRDLRDDLPFENFNNEKMKKLLAILLISGLSLVSCNDDEITGEIIVTAGRLTGYDGTPIGLLNVGLFDMNVLVTNRFFHNEAISTEVFIQGRVEFKEVNPGNYVVALVPSGGLRQTVQVRAGKSVTVDLSR